MPTTDDNNYSYYDVFDADGSFLLRSRASVIKRILRLGASAWHRVETEAPGGLTKLYFNGKPNPLGNGPFVQVQWANSTRDN